MVNTPRDGSPDLHAILRGILSEKLQNEQLAEALNPRGLPVQEFVDQALAQTDPSENFFEKFQLTDTPARIFRQTPWTLGQILTHSHLLAADTRAAIFDKISKLPQFANLPTVQDLTTLQQEINGLDQEEKNKMQKITVNIQDFFPDPQKKYSDFSILQKDLANRLFFPRTRDEFREIQNQISTRERSLTALTEDFSLKSYNFHEIFGENTYPTSADFFAKISAHFTQKITKIPETPRLDRAKLTEISQQFRDPEISEILLPSGHKISEKKLEFDESAEFNAENFLKNLTISWKIRKYDFSLQGQEINNFLSNLPLLASESNADRIDEIFKPAQQVDAGFFHDPAGENPDEYDEDEEPEQEIPGKLGLDVWREKFKNTPCVPGTMIFLQTGDSIFKDTKRKDHLSGSGNFVAVTITNVNDWENPTHIDFKINGLEGELQSNDTKKSIEGKSYQNRPLSEQNLQKRSEKNNITFPPATNTSKIHDFIENVAGQISDKKVKDIADTIATSFKNKEITSIGKVIDNTFLKFSCSFWDGKVTISSKDWFARTMNFAQFLVFVADKDLQIFTKETEADLNKKHHPGGDYSKWIKFVTIESLKNGAKERRKAARTDYREEKRKERTKTSKEFLSNALRGLEDFPILWDPVKKYNKKFDLERQDRQAEKIDEYKKEFMDNHSRKGEFQKKNFEKIDALLAKVAAWTHTNEDRLKLFAALMYLLEKFKDPYYKQPKKYVGQNIWARALLNPKQFEEHQKSVEDIKRKVLGGGSLEPPSAADLESLRNAEMQQLLYKIREFDHRQMYSDAKIGELNSAFTETQGAAPREEWSKNTQSMNFQDALKNELKDNLREKRYDYVIGILGEMIKKDETQQPANYKLWMRSVLATCLTPGITRSANRDSRSFLRDVLRKNWFPCASYLDHANTDEKFADFLETVAPGFKSATGRWFSESGRADQAEKFFPKFDTRREKNADAVLPRLENRDGIRLTAEQTSKRISAEYLENALGTKSFSDTATSVPAQPRLLKKTALNIPPTTVQTQYLQNVREPDKEQAREEFRNSLTTQLKNLAKNQELPQQNFIFIAQKFLGYFQNNMANGNYALFVNTLRSYANGKLQDAAPISFYLQRKNNRLNSPKMNAAVSNFEQIFKKFATRQSPEEMEKIFPEIFNYKWIDADWPTIKESITAAENSRRDRPDGDLPESRAKHISQYLDVLRSQASAKDYYPGTNYKKNRNPEEDDAN